MDWSEKQNAKVIFAENKFILSRGSCLKRLKCPTLITSQLRYSQK